jgi:Xaa-Pro aminopeptidase
VGPGGLRRFVTDFRYVSQSEAQLDPIWDRRLAAQDLLGAGLPDHLPAGDGTRALGFDDASVSVKGAATLAGILPEGLDLTPAGGLVEALREIKDPGEVQRIRAAAVLADAALEAVLDRGVMGRTEAAVALDLEIEVRRAGAQGVSFRPIVAHGAHGALPHAEPRDVPIAGGTLLTIDWGAELDGYLSDCTRTFAVGDVGDEERAVYDLVLRAQVAALAAVKPGPTGREVDAVARDIIDAAGHADHFGHGLGHGVGLEIHEGPRLSRTGEGALAAGMIVTVEPGVYVPGHCGVRIEDLALVTADGHEVLNTLPKDLRTIG